LLLGRAVQLKCSPTGQQVEDEYDNCQDQEDMNPAAHGIAADQSKDPENEQYDRDRPKHFEDLLRREFDLR
jgi:hypothetical protein